LSQLHDGYSNSPDPSFTTIIPAQWLARPSPEVAPALLGCYLVRKLPEGQRIRGLIVETEAYGPGDPACHGYRRRTPRNEVMFGPAGYSYVYLIYGMYYCLNVVTDADNTPSAVLIRALALESMPEWIPEQKKRTPHRIASGPGLVCQALKIDRSHHGVFLGDPSSLWLEFPNCKDTSPSLPVVATTRIGLTQGKDIPWRWYIQGHPAVSRFKT
jgi:DNA-3-methyladenine glycosylase